MDTAELERPVLAVDVVLFGIHDRKLKVLLHTRQKEPFRDAPALPGVAVRVDETLETAARRAVYEKTDWKQEDSDNLFLEQLAAFDALYRDPRGRTISLAFMGIVRTMPEEKQGMIWKDCREIAEGSLPFDHGMIVKTAVQRLRGKLRYTNIAKGFLPETFRIEELQNVYEIIMEYSLNRANFRNRLLKLGMIEQVTVLTEAVGKKGGRPPHLYRFTRDLIEMTERDFL
ncbi:MAG: NUDIX domain-containing protein [Desulfococcaceae bacterium]